MKLKLISGITALALCTGGAALAVSDRTYVDSYLPTNGGNGTENPYYGPITVSNVLEDSIENIPADLEAFKMYAQSSSNENLKNTFLYAPDSVNAMPWVPQYFRMLVSDAPTAIKMIAQSPCTVTYNCASGTKAYAYKLSEGMSIASNKQTSYKNFTANGVEYAYDERVNLASNGKAVLENGIYLISNCPGEFTQTPSNPYSYSYIIEVQSPVAVEVLGKLIEMDQPAVIKNGRTLVPLRAIFEALGASVEWDGNTKTVTATKGSDVITLTVNENVLKKNGVSTMLEVPAQIMGGRTMVPARAVAEAFNMRVTWDGRSSTVIVAEKK